MKWYGISGSWRRADGEIRRDVERAVKKIVEQGDGIVTGGALGVDFIATRTVLAHGDPAKQLKLYLPVKLDDFCRHYEQRAREGVISEEQAQAVIGQLREVATRALMSIFDDWGLTEVNQASYFRRNTEIAKNCDELLAFWIDKSAGTGDTIRKARKLGKKVRVKQYFSENK